MKRIAGVRGQFYPQSCQEINSMIDRYNKIINTHIKDPSILNEIPRAIISPHAGYVYSGFGANLAHRLLANSKAKRVFIFGPSHHVFIDGISVSEFDSYESPCGDMVIDLSYIEMLKERFSLTFTPQAHKVEHSTETQVPFIKHYLPDAKIVEFIYGKVDPKKIADIIYTILQEKDNVVVISTDLSHFYTEDRAKKLDHICLEAVDKMDTNMLDSGCEACGKLGISAILEASKALKLHTKILDYRTSADVSKDKSRVVGYMSAIVR
jgi:AmmeMemoRadiSam system protein B